MLLSLLLSTASASEATLPPEPPALEAQAATSIWTAPPQLSISQGRRLGHVRQIAAVGSVLSLSAATLSTWIILANNSPSFNQGLARGNVVAFALPGAVLGAASLIPSLNLTNQGVRCTQILAVASIGAGVSSLFISAETRAGNIPPETMYLAAALAWASPILALSEVLLASRVGWQQHDSSLRLQFAPSPNGAKATMTWSF